jgi:hypothetical protein
MVISLDNVSTSRKNLIEKIIPEDRINISWDEPDDYSIELYNLTVEEYRLLLEC